MDFADRARAQIEQVCRIAFGGSGGGTTIDISGAPPVLPSAFEVDLAAVVSIGAVATAAARLAEERGGRAGRVSVDVRHAAAVFRSERHLRVDGERAPDPWSPLSGFYATRDGWVQLHTNFAHHLEAACGALGAPPERAEVEKVIATRSAREVEDVVVAHGGCAAACRSEAEWLAHPHGAAVDPLPLLEVERLDAARSVPWREVGGVAPPLAGVRVLDLTRVIAGPVSGRALASYGAEVLRIGAAHLPVIPALVIDTGFGKRFAHLDLRRAVDVATMRSLVRDADVVVQSYRPGSLARRGFSPTDLAALRPGIICVELSAWGHGGPWAERRGYDSLVQTASGIAMEESLVMSGSSAREEKDWQRPRHLPAAALDHATGYFAALGAMAALSRRAGEGGSWRVRVSLAQTARWLARLGRTAHDARRGPDQSRRDVAGFLAEMPSPHGHLSYVLPAAAIDGVAPRYDGPPPQPGADPPRWR